jgi:hypothetical protein
MALLCLIEGSKMAAMWTHLWMFLYSKFHHFRVKCWTLLKPVLAGVDGNLHLPVLPMNRLNQTEPAKFSILACWTFFRDSVFLFFNGGMHQQHSFMDIQTQFIINVSIIYDFLSFISTVQFKWIWNLNLITQISFVKYKMFSKFKLSLCIYWNLTYLPDNQFTEKSYYCRIVLYFLLRWKNHTIWIVHTLSISK